MLLWRMFVARASKFESVSFVVYFTRAPRGRVSKGCYSLAMSHGCVTTSSTHGQEESIQSCSG